MGKLSYVIATALLGLATNAFAVNFADVYQAAVENDPVLGAAQQDYAAREEVVPQTRAGLLPSINLNGSTAYNRLEYPDGRFIDPIPRARASDNCAASTVKTTIPTVGRRSWCSRSSTSPRTTRTRAPKR